MAIRRPLYTRASDMWSGSGVADGSSGLRAIHTTCTDYKSPPVERPVEAARVHKPRLLACSFDGAGGAVALEAARESEGIPAISAGRRRKSRGITFSSIASASRWRSRCSALTNSSKSRVGKRRDVSGFSPPGRSEAALTRAPPCGGEKEEGVVERVK